MGLPPVAGRIPRRLRPLRPIQAQLIWPYPRNMGRFLMFANIIADSVGDSDEHRIFTHGEDRDFLPDTLSSARYQKANRGKNASPAASGFFLRCPRAFRGYLLFQPEYPARSRRRFFREDCVDGGF